MAMSTNGALETDGFGQDEETASLSQLKSQQSLLLQEIDDDLGDGLGDDASLQEGKSLGAPTASIVMPGLQPFDRGKSGLPSSWSNGTLSGNSPLCLMSLAKQSWEFQTILSEFRDAGLMVMQIERIENRDLWEKFEFEEKRMKKKTAVVNEVYLFHGTMAPKEQICHEGLDQRLSRIGFFGRGIYFSNDPRKCVSYTQSEEQSHNIRHATCTVYKCRVLLGNMKVYPPGKHDKHLKREPPLENPEPGGQKYHDSVKGHVLQFDEFVIYKSERVMPEYVITCFSPAAPSTDEAPVIGQPASTSTDQEDLYGGLDEDEINAELRAASAMNIGASKGGSLVEGVYRSLDEEEISAELKAGALQVSQLGNEEINPELEEEESMDHGSPQEASVEELHQANTHWELAMEEQCHHLQEVRPDVRTPVESTDSSRNRPVETTESDLGVVVNCLDGADDKASKTGVRTAPARHFIPGDQPSHRDDASAWGSTSDVEHQHQLEAVRSRMKVNQPSKLAGESLAPTKSDITVNSFQESRGHRKEVIDPEFMSTILEVRERVRRARLQESKDSEAKKKKGDSPRKPLKGLSKEPDPSAWAPEELAKHKELLESIRVKVQADRKEEQQRKRKGTGKANWQDVTDNSASCKWEGSDDGIQELLDTLIVQFMEFTACEEIEEAREYVLKASMDVNKAIVNYLNG